MKYVIALFALSASLFAASYVSRPSTQSVFKDVPLVAPVALPTQPPMKNASEAVAPKQVEKLEVIVLTEDNMIVMDKSFSDQSVTSVMLDLQKLSEKIDKNATIYLVLNTPGGSIDAGLRLISFIKALPQKVKTLTLFAASMGFMTAQGLDERLVLDTGTLMSHRARYGCQGEASGEIDECIRFTMSIVTRLEQNAASRMGMSLKAYRELIRDEYWAYGPDAVASRAADRMVLAKCGKGLANQTKQSIVETMFGDFNLTISKCPLIPGYIDVKAVGMNENTEALNYVKLMMNDKSAFVREYIKTNKWTEFQK